MPTLLLVRHARAGERGAWVGDDALRPLDARGRVQAEELAGLLPTLLEPSDEPPKVRSSPALRCVATVTPTAARLGVEVHEDEGLFEGAAIAPLLARLATLASDEIWSSHGDVIPALLDRLAREGLDLGPRPTCRKASTWVLTVSEGRAIRATSIAPPG